MGFELKSLVVMGTNFTDGFKSTTIRPRLRRSPTEVLSHKLRQIIFIFKYMLDVVEGGRKDKGNNIYSYN